MALSGMEVLRYLADTGVDAEQLIHASPLSPPPTLDTSHSLSSYYVSTSHNTYLQENQLYGISTAATYLHVLSHNGRCVEIDAWDGDNGEPCVYHGWTLTKPVPVRDVIVALNESVQDESSTPILVSLENHCSPAQQDVLASLFKTILGDKLVHGQIDGQIDIKQVTLSHLLGKVLIKIEHFGDDGVEEAVEAVEGDEEAAQVAKKKLACQTGKITPALADLGVYTQSVKPTGLQWFSHDIMKPLQRVVNISESALLKLLPTKALDSILNHTSTHLMRVYPKGLRISSGNLDPLPFWQAGSQLVALNWQRFDLAMQLNTALFADTHGWKLKPSHLLPQSSRASNEVKKRKCNVTVWGACDLPWEIKDVKRDQVLKPYVKVSICTGSGQGKKCQTTKKYVPVKQYIDLARNPIWGQIFKFEWNDESLVFLRFRLFHDEPFERDEVFASYTCLMERLESGWKMFKLLDVNGQPLQSSLIVNIEF